MKKIVASLLRFYRILLLAVVLGYAGLIAFAYFFANAMIFPVPTSSYVDDASIRKLALPSGEKISIKYVPVQNPYFTILYSHGNREDLGTISDVVSAFNQEGYSMLAYEYPGYGTSTGQPTEKNAYASIQSVYEYAINELKIPGERIILYGRSLGCGPAVELALKYDVGGVILEGAFVSAFRVVTVYPLLFWDNFNNIDKIKEINAPMLMIHGTEDSVVPFWHGEKLYEAALRPKRKFWVNGAGHNNLVEKDPAGYWVAVNSFLKTIKKEQLNREKRYE